METHRRTRVRTQPSGPSTPGSGRARTDSGLVLAGLLMLALFVSDVLTPLDLALWLLYLLPLLLVSWFAPRRAVLAAAALSTILIVAGFVLSPAGGSPVYAIANRLLGVAVLWITAVLLLQLRRSNGALLPSIQRFSVSEEELRQAHEQIRQEAELLEQRVQERTAQLEAANAALAERTQQLRASWEQAQAFSRRLVEATENERKAISRELHDESGQGLTSLIIGLGLAQRRADCSDEMRQRLEDLKSQTEAIMQDLHRLSKDLRPASLDRLGLAAAVKQYVDGFSSQYGLAAQFEAIGVYEDGNTPAEIKTTLYRVVQEALTNVARHAQATHVEVLLQRTDECVTAIIEDDGLGFDVEKASRAGRLGLLGMRERLDMVGGELDVESAPGSGTTIVACVPLPDRSN